MTQILSFYVRPVRYMLRSSLGTSLTCTTQKRIHFFSEGQSSLHHFCMKSLLKVIGDLFEILRSVISQGYYLIKWQPDHVCRCLAGSCPSDWKAPDQVTSLIFSESHPAIDRLIMLISPGIWHIFGAKNEFWTKHCGKCCKQHSVEWSPGLVITINFGLNAFAEYSLNRK